MVPHVSLHNFKLHSQTAGSNSEYLQAGSDAKKRNGSQARYPVKMHYGNVRRRQIARGLPGNTYHTKNKSFI